MDLGFPEPKTLEVDILGKEEERGDTEEASNKYLSAYDLSVPEVWTKHIEADLDIAGSVPDHVNKAKIAIKWVKNNYIKKSHTVL